MQGRNSLIFFWTKHENLIEFSMKIRMVSGQQESRFVINISCLLFLNYIWDNLILKFQLIIRFVLLKFLLKIGMVSGQQESRFVINIS